MSPKEIRRKASSGKEQEPQRREVDLRELTNILDRARETPLNDADHDKLSGAINTLAVVTHELEQKGITVLKLRKLLFGSSSERTRDVVGQTPPSTPPSNAGDAPSSTTEEEPGKVAAADAKQPESDADKTKKRKGHGRNGADAYAGAERVTVPHESLAHGDPCPTGDKGRVYRLPQPAQLVRVTGIAPLLAMVYELERLRCNLCGKVFTATAPEGVGEEKYDEKAKAMIALLKYGCGLPFNRMERLGAQLKMPLPSATQWDVVESAAEEMEPVWGELINQAADGEVVYIDDTKARVLALNEQIRQDLATGRSNRTGIFTSGVISTVGESQMAIFFTGREHAGENLAKVLALRRQNLPPPIQMSDALSRNTSPGDFETIVANCLVHGRRNFVDVVNSFPDEVAHVLEVLGQVYLHDAEARAAEMSPEQRLAHHRAKSKPLMDELHLWLKRHVDERLVEPNSSLGAAIKYMQNHWPKLTLFLEVPGAPLDNNITERALKKAILHRKNSLFYRTPNGAHVGDVFISLIHTCELNGVDSFNYLVALQRNAEAVAVNPELWMPWNYAETLSASQTTD